jgi:N-dimethylarginine dimethylaminohydrolase
VGIGALTQEQENLAETLSQVGADPHIQRVHGVRAGAGDDLWGQSRGRR